MATVRGEVVARIDGDEGMAIVDRLSELCVAANNDPKVKEVLASFALEPAIGYKESNALYQRELPGLDRGRQGARAGAGVIPRSWSV